MLLLYYYENIVRPLFKLEVHFVMLLVVSTSSKKLICSIVNDDRHIEFLVLETKSEESLPSTIDELLSRHNISMANISKILLDVGPGSFSGIRIGIAYVIGVVAVMPHIIVAPMNILDLIAETYHPDLAVLQSPNGRFYVKYRDCDTYDAIDLIDIENRIAENKSVIGVCDYTYVPSITNIALQDLIISQCMNEDFFQYGSDIIEPCYINGMHNL